MNLENIVLELLSRIQTLENEVEKLKKQNNSTDIIASLLQNEEDEEPERVDGEVTDLSNVLNFLDEQREVHTYIYDLVEYSNNDLVLAVVKDVLSDNMTTKEALDLFNDNLQGKYGVLKRVEDVKRSHFENFFFTEKENIIHLQDGDMYVCSQWGKFNTDRFVNYCINTLDIEIEKI